MELLAAIPLAWVLVRLAEKCDRWRKPTPKEIDATVGRLICENAIDRMNNDAWRAKETHGAVEGASGLIARRR